MVGFGKLIRFNLLFSLNGIWIGFVLKLFGKLFN